MYTLVNIIIPVYDEGENIVDTFREIEKKVETPHEIFIIYDFEEDNTVPVVKKLSQGKTNIHLVKNIYERGVINAIKTGFEMINEGVILVAMADLSDDFAKIDQMMEKINEGYDVVCGSRYMKGGKQTGGPLIKVFLSRTAGILLHYLIKIPTHDVTNNFKMYTKKLLRNIVIESKGGFELAMEILIKAFLSGYRITEVPCVSFSDRKTGQSKFKLVKWLPHYLYWYWFAIKGSIRKKMRIMPF